MSHLCSCLLKLISCLVTFVVPASGRSSIPKIGLLPSADGCTPLHSTYPFFYVSHSRGLDLVLPHPILSESHLTFFLYTFSPMSSLYFFNSRPISTLLHPHGPPLTSSVIHAFRSSLEAWEACWCFGLFPHLVVS